MSNWSKLVECACRGFVCSGDPAVFGNLPPHPAVNEALKEVAVSGAYSGMTLSTGLPEAKHCVAEQLSKYPGPRPVQPQVGCSSAVVL